MEHELDTHPDADDQPHVEGDEGAAVAVVLLRRESALSICKTGVGSHTSHILL